MPTNPYALLRIPLAIFLCGALIWTSFPYRARGDDVATDASSTPEAIFEATSSEPAPSIKVSFSAVAAVQPEGGPVFRTLYIPYPQWYGASPASSQDAFRFNDQTIFSSDIEDDVPITSVTLDASGLGLGNSLPVPMYMERSPTLHMYELPLTVTSHTTGSTTVRVTATDQLGRSATLTHEVRLDNIPPRFRLDSVQFVHSTTTPVMNDPVLISGWIDDEEAHVQMMQNIYYLYDKDKNKLIYGSFGLKNNALATARLGKGTFTNFDIPLWLDHTDSFKIADPSYAKYMSVELMVSDGAGNTTTVQSDLVPIPQTGTTTQPAPVGISNVLFLPGIEGSRLYRADDTCDIVKNDCVSHKEWDPASDENVRNLFLTSDGKSVKDIYTKDGDIINSMGDIKFYSSFASQMTGLKSAGTISDWKSVAYDWRLSLDDLLTKGTLLGTKIDYTRASSTPYIESTLRSLAASSKTGKVTIIAHSNGGLVAKALMVRLGTQETARLIDKVIFVGVPQSGTPQALAGLLHGYGAALPADWCATWKAVGSVCSQIATRVAGRSFAQNAPAAYHLLPSSAFFTPLSAAAEPIISFVGSHLFSQERITYGSTIKSAEAMNQFVRADEGGRTQPTETNIDAPTVANPTLLAYALAWHQKLDSWIPPASVQVYEIAGTGKDTLSSIQYYEVRKASVPAGYSSRYRPRFSKDGDNVVPTSSALLMPPASNVHRFWLDLAATTGGASHANLFEVKDLRDLMQSIIKNTAISLGQSLHTDRPAALANKQLLVTLHGSGEIAVTHPTRGDAIVHADGSTEQTLTEATLGKFGATSYLLLPEDSSYQLTITGNGGSPAALDIEETDMTNTLASTTYEGIPMASQAHTMLSNIQMTDPLPLQVDLEDDGTTDLQITPNTGDADTDYAPPAPAATTTDQTPAPSTGTSISTTTATQTTQGTTSGGTVPVVIITNSPSPTTSTSKKNNSKKKTVTTVKKTVAKTATTTKSNAKKATKTTKIKVTKPKISQATTTSAAKTKTVTKTKPKKTTAKKKTTKKKSAKKKSNKTKVTAATASSTEHTVALENTQQYADASFTSERDAPNSVPLLASVSTATRSTLRDLLEKLHQLLITILAYITLHPQH